MSLTAPLFRRFGLRLAHFHAAPHERVRAHQHDTTHLFFLLDGELEQGAGRAGVTLASDCARLSGADAVHDIDFGADGGECLVAHFETTAPVRGSHFFTPESVTSHAAALRSRLARPEQAPLLYLDIRHAMAALTRETASVPDWLLHARAMLVDSKTPTVSAVAATIGISREHLSRLFLAAFGETPQRTRQCARAARTASALALHPVEAAAELAWQHGYADQSHMIREFRALFGRTPRQFACSPSDHKNSIARR